MEGNGFEEVGSNPAGAGDDGVAACVAREPTSAEGVDSNPEKASSNVKDFTRSCAIGGSFGAEDKLKSSSARVGGMEPLTSVVGGNVTGMADGGAEVLGDGKTKNSSKVASEENCWPSEAEFEAPVPLRVGINFKASSNADMPVLSAAEGTVVDVPVKEGSNGLVGAPNASKVLWAAALLESVGGWEASSV